MLLRAERGAQASETAVDRLRGTGLQTHSGESEGNPWLLVPGPGHVLLPRERAQRNEGMTPKAAFSLRSKEWETHS